MQQTKRTTWRVRGAGLVQGAAVLWLALAGCACTGVGADATAGADARPTAALNIEALWQQYRASDTARALRTMLDQNAITADGDTMPIRIELIWDEAVPMPDDGYPVFISMHGGGAFTEIENHEQWEIQFTRYPGVRGLYVCPHSPVDNWDQWHNARVFKLIDTLVRAMLLRDDVDANRVYLGGYCSGGNGVYQLAPILADRFAACSATKAIGEGAPLVNLRNLPIDIQWGEHDRETLDRPGHNRANVDALLALHRDDPAGYTFRDIEHWRQGKVVNDKSTMRWMSRYTRDPYPDRVVWQQDGDVRATSNPPQHRMYWLGVDDDYAYDGTTDIADARLDRATNTVHINAEGYERLHIYLNDEMLDLDRPVTVVVNGRAVPHEMRRHTERDLLRQLERTGDREQLFSASVEVRIE